MISYVETTEGICGDDLEGFFEGWPKPPSGETHLRLLRGSDLVVLAMDGESNAVVGFVTAITDGVLAAYIPLLEVRPEYRGAGVGSELMRRVLERLDDLYMVDVVCDADLQPFYASQGMKPMTAMMIRNFDRQSGRSGP